MEHENLEVSLLLNASGYREDKIGDTEYYVCPTTLLVEGVHKGNKGGLFYSKTQLKKWVGSWNNKPVVVNSPTGGHPKVNGKFKSAGKDKAEKILAKTKVGILLNTSCPDKRLETEAWIEKSLIKKHAPEIEKMILNKEEIEVSTGLDAGFEEENGVYNGETYTHSVVDFQPDHLAILGKEKGACSCKKGCGMNVRNSEEDIPEWIGVPDCHIVNAEKDLSFDEITARLALALRNTYGKPGVSYYGYPVAVYNNCVIWSDNGTGYWKQEYSIANDEVKLKSGTPEQVVRRVTYETADGKGYVANSAGELCLTHHNPEVDSMNEKKKKIIDEMIANGLFTEQDREQLDTMDEKQLEFAKKTATQVLNRKKDDEEDKKKKVKKEEPIVNESDDEWLKKAPKSVQRTLAYADKITAKAKAGYIETIMNAEDNPFTEDELNAFENLDQLEKMATLAKPKSIVNEESEDEEVKEEEIDEDEVIANSKRPAKRIPGTEKPATNPNSRVAPKSGHMVLPKLDYSKPIGR